MISIIVPVYNTEKYLKRCVNSILAQTYTDLEIILVDDGSKDSSGFICDEYAKQDQRIKVVHKKNGGVSSARNLGLDLAQGEYIAFVDSDDYLDSNMYEEMYKVALKYNCEVVLTDCIKEYTNESQLYTHDIRSGYYNLSQLKEEYYPHLLMMENVEYPATISNGLILFRRKMNRNSVLPKYIEGVRYSEDLLFGAQLMYNADSFYYMKNQAYYHYCMNDDSATHRFCPDKWNDYLKLYCETKNYFKEEVFSKQIDKMLLFFVYNTVGELLHTNSLDKTERIKKSKSILKCKEVKEMFDRIRIFSLPIPFKLKVLTCLYKYRIGLWLL